MSLTVMDWFCGAGGSSQGLHQIPGVTVARAANHWARAIETHQLNFPDADHWTGDIRDAPVSRWPACDIFWASPECPQWSNARGKARDFDWKAAYLEGLEKWVEDTTPLTDEEAERSRALMDEVPYYLAGVQRRGGCVLAGVVENVVEVRAWSEWDRWLSDIRNLGYHTRVIAFNSMHASGTRTPRAPQSRDRLYVAYWHKSLGRTPDWDKWLRPMVWCPSCETAVQAVQAWKRPGNDMGRYRTQYVYRCPRTSCRNQVIEPDALPAAAAIDWSLPGQRIGDRAKPLADKTMKRIETGLDKFARPLVVPAGGTWRTEATSVAGPFPARTTRENDGIAIPPLLVPVEGRDGKEPRSANDPLRTQTARNETGLAWLPWMVELRGGSSDSRSILDPAAAVTASGNHLGVAAALWPEEHLLLPYYGNSSARPVTEPVGALSTRDRYALVSGAVDIDDVLFRMLWPHEIGRAMAFAEDYIVTGNKREQVRQYGNAVTPPVAELIVSALVEAITGADLERMVLAA